MDESVRPPCPRLRIVQGTEVARDHLRQAIAIDRAYYDKELQGQLELCGAWHARNPDIFIMLVDDGPGIVAAYLNAMPVTDGYLDKLLSGDFIDNSLPPEAIRAYDAPGPYKVYFCSIAVHPEYRARRPAVMLLEAFFRKILELAQAGRYVTDIFADAITPEGRRLSAALGMSAVKRSGHQSVLYRASLIPPRFKPLTPSARRLSQLLSGEEGKDP